MGIGTLAKDGLSLQVPNKFVLSHLLNQLEPLSESTKRSRLIQNAEDAGRRAKEVLDFLQELTDVFPGLLSSYTTSQFSARNVCAMPGDLVV